MSVITGTLADFGFNILATFAAQIIFTPSGTVTGFGSGGVSLLLTTKPIVVTPSLLNGSFSTDLFPNSGTAPASWYTITIVWLDAAGNYVSRDEVPGRLIVPDAGGSIGNGMIRVGLSKIGVWLVTVNVPPVEALPGDFIFNTITNDFSLISA